MPQRKTTNINVRITETGKQILYALQDHYGLTQSGVFELILRDCARALAWDPENPRRKLSSTLGTGKGGRHG